MPEPFPSAVWTGIEAKFFPSSSEVPPPKPVYAALLFAFSGDRCAIADIAGRGWCIPGGRLEPGETAAEAVRREAHEEAGLTVGTLSLLGHYQLLDLQHGGISFAAVYAAAILSRLELPAGTESVGVRLVTLEELPTVYYLWDPLIASVCHYAFARRPW